MEKKVQVDEHIQTTLRAVVVYALATLPWYPASSLVACAQQAGGGRIRQQDTFTSQNILAPGETDDWPLAARDDETLIVGVSSENFDPVVELANPAGTTVTQNDDVRQGEQDAQLLARLDKGGRRVSFAPRERPGATAHDGRARRGHGGHGWARHLVVSRTRQPDRYPQGTLL